MKKQTCLFCGCLLNNRKLKTFCSVEHRDEMRLKNKNRPIEPHEMVILKKIWGENEKRQTIQDLFNVSSSYLTELVKRARKQLTDKQIREAYGL